MKAMRIGDDPMISYAHKDDPLGHRFLQHEKDRVPGWAVDVQPYSPDEPKEEGKMRIETVELNWQEPAPKRLHDVVGNESAKRAIEVVLSGQHEVVLIATVRSPASDLLRATARIAKENHIPFKGKVIPICPCGAYGSVKDECRCSAADLKAYARKVIPMMREADVVIETLEPRASETTKGNELEERMVARILAARRLTAVDPFLSPDAEELLRMAIKELGASREKATRVAATIARLNDDCKVSISHLSEAIQYQHRHMARWVDDFEEVTV